MPGLSIRRLSPAQALALRDRLGWTSSPTKEWMFTTDHDLEEKDASFTTVEAGGDTRTVVSFRMSLTSRIPKDVMDEPFPLRDGRLMPMLRSSPLSTVRALVRVVVVSCR